MGIVIQIVLEHDTIKIETCLEAEVSQQNHVCYDNVVPSVMYLYFLKFYYF